MGSSDLVAESSVEFLDNKVVLFWSFTVWLVVMNTTMFNVALPNVLLDLSLTSATAAWIVSGYSIVFAIATLTYSRLSDFIPISRLLLVGLSILGIASVIGFFANQFYLLLIARILQAAGAGAVPGLAMVLASRYIPLSRRGRAMAYIASAASLGFGLGPVIGGVITQYLGWNYLFVVTGLVFILLPIFFKLLPKELVKIGQFDLIGALLTGLCVTGLLLVLSTFSYVLLAGTIVLVGLWWRHIHRKDLPFIQPKLLKNKQYTKLLYIGFIAFVLHFSALFLMPLILTTVFEKEPAAVGLIIFPGAILSAVAAQFIGRFIDRFGNVPVIMFGQSSLVVATVLFALTATKAPVFILFTYMFMSVGFSAMTSSVSNEYSRILPKEEIGSGIGLAQLLQFFGGAFGVTMTGILLTWQQGVLEQLSYQNIFIVLIGLIISSVCVFGLYIKGAHVRRN
ncbi:MFS transporter [Anaerobacillus isosaccharinicus]|uniref:MFS transporter n=1 Tax=Anaerobacillus isosaccharinicus TaxID=1532552 RepID=A0A1S2LHQ2_9BACI|nr:MFS transporter [Anaerobacillus isosaccharinicus]MBA5586604.1 MFS transporter [Anaerobacillus isosaccharinicus]QOY35161.1 MFS transporter [Anaerobacillus isosaccharinicus]